MFAEDRVTQRSPDRAVAVTMAPRLPTVHSVPRSPRRIVALDGLRGVAALMVLFHHTMLMLPDFANVEWGVPGATAHGTVEWLLLRTPLRLLWSGQARALLFFVLSGFVLSLPWLNGRSAPYGRFLLGRFCRIYPPYIVAMVAAALGSILLGGHKLDHATIYFNQLGWAYRPTWEAVPSVLGIIDNRSSSFMNEAMWTLVWEVRTALIFPLLMLPIVRWGNVGVGLVLAALILLKHASARLVAPWIADALNNPQDIFYYAQYFVFGAAVAGNRARIAAWFGRRGDAFGLGCVVVGCLICWLPWPAQHDRMIGLGAAVVIVAIIGSIRIQGWLTNRPLLWLGRQSYSLYLVHLPVIMIFIIAFQGQVPLLAVCMVVPAALLLAWAFHHWMETPSVAIAQRLTGYSERTVRIGRTSPATPVEVAAAGAPPVAPLGTPAMLSASSD